MVILSFDHVRKLGLVLMVAVSTISTGTNSAPSYALSERTAVAERSSPTSPTSHELPLPPAVNFKAAGSKRDEEGNSHKANVITIAKQPKTPPESLDSDPYAQYTYKKEFNPSSGNLKAHRTIVVGDVHGSLAGLQGLLNTVNFDPKQDEIILVGDMVAKGPQSLQVIDKAIEIGAKCVRGNHDDKVIRWRGYLDKSGGSLDNVPDDLDEDSEHYEIAKRLSQAQYKFLLSCPLILSIPKEVSVRRVPVYVVHAGIDPSENINNQLPWVLLNVRNILDDGTPTRKKKKGDGWAELFNENHKNANGEGFMMIYGHDAGRSLNVNPWSIGLDSGCVYGGKLSGYVLETGKVYSSPCPGSGEDDEDE
ncbi:hypothetical protein FBU30_004068 [Linnemannia zychae]|nr:hypothetical protein FBU30_004068 [Linnemannia zychae]